MHAFSSRTGLSLSDASSNSSRKRARRQHLSNRCENNYQFDSSGTWKDLHASSTTFGNFNPASIAYSTYQQQYDLNTSTPNDAAYFATEGTSSDQDSTQRWTSVNSDSGKQTIYTSTSAVERTGRKRVRSSSQASQQGQSWGSYVYSMVGGIAGKMINLVGAGSFIGFTAGGGQGYEMTASGPRKVIFSPPRDAEGRWSNLSQPSLPGQYPEEDFDEDTEAEDETGPAKRKQILVGNDWVMVDWPPNQHPRNSSSNYLHSTPPRRPASRASFRPAQPRRPRMSSGRVTSVSYTGSPEVINEHRRSASFVAPCSPSSAQDPRPSTPPKIMFDADLQKYSARKQREVRQSDASMSRLNSQLQAMIKEGKQALASTIEVQDHDDHDDDDGLVYDSFGGPLAYETHMR